MSTPPSLSATFALLNKNKTAPKDGEEATPDLMPTAKARHVMERLINGSPSDFERSSPPSPRSRPVQLGWEKPYKQAPYPSFQ